MKNIIFIFSLFMIFSSCRTDFYENDRRTIVEGYVHYYDKPLQNATVIVRPTENAKNATTIIKELNPNEEGFGSDGYIITKLKTDINGKISFSLPRNDRTDTYVIEITRDYQ